MVPSVGVGFLQHGLNLIFLEFEAGKREQAFEFIGRQQHKSMIERVQVGPVRFSCDVHLEQVL